MKITARWKGGPGSGHHGHAGRPGKRGGSLPGGSAAGGKKPKASQSFHMPGQAANIFSEKMGSQAKRSSTNENKFRIGHSRFRRAQDVLTSMGFESTGAVDVEDFGKLHLNYRGRAGLEARFSKPSVNNNTMSLTFLS